MISFFKKYQHHLLLAAIFGLAAILIFFNLDRSDIQLDDATYSFRALGYLDYMDSIDTQTTPLVWFEELPWWSKLSFHDAPPLVFILQFVFFKLFGDSVLAARLPFALAGFGSILLLYLVGKKIKNENFGLLAALVLTILTAQVWASRVGLLEIVALFFILLTLYFFLLALEHPKHFIWFGVSLGLMMLTKYTTFFVLPALFFYLLITNRKLLLNKFLVLGLSITTLIFSPVFVYNVMMFKTRGHFDLQFAKIFGQDMSDWPGITSGVSANYFSNIVALWNNNGHLISWPLYIFFLLLLIIFLLALVIKYQVHKNNLLVALLLLFISIQFIFIQPEPRFLSILNPLIALVVAGGIFIVHDFLMSKGKGKTEMVFSVVAIGAIFGYELFYNINTNLLLRPIGQPVTHYSENRLENLGLQQVESYFNDQYHLNDAKPRSITNINQLTLSGLEEFSNKNIYIFDPSVNWFSTLWHFRRHAIYRNEIFVSAADLSKAVPVSQWLDIFHQFGVKNIYYIWLVQDGPMPSDERTRINREASRKLSELFASTGAQVANINNDNNKLSFKIYRINLEELNYEPR